MTKKVTEHIMVGLAIGFVATTACLWIFKVYEASGMAVMRQFTTWLAASVLYGLISLIYDTNIPFPISLIIHFIGCATITFIASIVSGIMEFMLWYQWFIYVLPVFIGIYLIIGIAVCISSRYHAKKINNKISGQTKGGH